jgi:AraC-like DNA-binding protein
MHPSFLASESSEINARQAPLFADGDRSASWSLERLCTLAAQCNYSTRGLAKRLGISVRQLQRTFQARLQCSPRDWLREVRLQRARDMLQAAASVKQVAYALGFRQQSQFCRDFKLRFGFSPSKALPAGNGLRTLLKAAKRTGICEDSGAPPLRPVNPPDGATTSAQNG